MYDCFSFDCCEYHFFQVHYFAQLTNVEVEFCIGEWSAGLFIKKASFDEVDNQPRYEAHYQKLREWHSLNPTVVNNILQKKYDRMRCVVCPYLLLTYHSRSHRKSSGIAISRDISVEMSDAAKEAAMKELEGHTGDTDSEID